MTRSLEDQIRHALKRVPAPTGLEQKILDEVKSGPPARKVRKGSLWLAAAAGLLLIATAGFLAYRDHQAEIAKNQLIFALRLTSQKLDQAFEIAMQQAQRQIKQTTEEERP